MILADYLAQFLSTQGITHVFDLPGGENVTVVESLRKAGIDLVLFHHEAAAGFAAGVSGQLTGQPGVCLSTVGPGAVNLVAAAAAATLERSPMLAITADIDGSWLPRVTHMKLDLHGLFAPVTKGSFRLTPETAGQTLIQAWRLALRPPCGAVHLAVSPDMAAMMVGDSPPGSVSPVTYPKVNQADLSSLSAYLRPAGTPFILAGLGVEAAGAQVELLALAEKWGAPVAVTPKAKGHFPERHPLFAGCFTAYGDEPLRQALAGADLILGVGLDSVDFVTSTWDIKTPVVNLNLAGADDPALKPVVALNGDLGDMLRRLAEVEVGDNSGKERAATLRQAIARRLITPDIRPQLGNVALHTLITALRRALPEESAVTVDVGAFKLVFLQAWPTDTPKSLFVANGLSAMGYAVPGALAIRLARPDLPVVAIAGDGALLMYAGELATVARLNRPLIILALVDQALALIRLKQLRQRVPFYGTEFSPTDYSALAGAFGLEYRLIDGSEDPQEILGEVVQLPRPVLVEARIDRAEYDRYL